MRIEEIKPEEETVVKECQASYVRIEEIRPVVRSKQRSGSYLFPLSKGYNRLLFVLWILLAIIVGVVVKGATLFPGVAILVLVVEFILYLAAIWVYWGFKKSGDEKTV